MLATEGAAHKSCISSWSGQLVVWLREQLRYQLHGWLSEARRADERLGWEFIPHCLELLQLNASVAQSKWWITYFAARLQLHPFPSVE